MTDERTKNVYNYYKALIALRKDHPSFRISEIQDVISNQFVLKTTKKVKLAGEEILESLVGGELLMLNSNSTYVFHRNLTSETPLGLYEFVQSNNSIFFVIGSISALVAVKVGITLFILFKKRR